MISAVIQETIHTVSRNLEFSINTISKSSDENLVKFRSKAKDKSSIESSTNNTNDGSIEPTSSRSSFEEESTVGKYILVKTIGRGKFATVKLAKHLFLDKEVAIKIYDKTEFTTYSVQTLFREIRIMKTLNHPNIVKLFEVIETERNLYLVLEYAAGGDLFSYLELRGKLNEKKARAMFRQIVSAVEYCHQMKIIHRDLKDENILLDSEMNIKIADFGLSKEFTPENKSNTFCGTLAYIAPEIYQEKKYGPEVDVWSLGIVLYVLVTGTLPFDGSTKLQIKRRVLRCNYVIPRYVSKSCRNILKKVLVLNPAVRPNLKTIMKERWLNQGYENSELRPYVEANSVNNLR